MRIAYFSQYYPPEMGAPAARVSELAKEWASLGHDVEVVTGFPNHPTGVVPPEYRGEFIRRETIDGVHVVRVPIYAAANKGRVRRSLAYGSFGLTASAIGPRLIKRPDVLIATSPQFLTAVAGYAASVQLRCPFVFEVRDLWPESIVAVGALPATHPVVRGLEVAEKFLYEQADQIVVVSSGFVEPIRSKGIAPERISVITNGVDLEKFSVRLASASLRASVGVRPDQILSLYVGTHGMAHGLENLLRTADEMRTDPRFVFGLIGEGADKARLREIAASRSLPNVVFVDQQPRERIPDWLAAADICLVLLRDKDLFKSVIPSKIFEYMAMERPIVTCVDGVSREIVERANAGRFVMPEDPAALARVVRQLGDDANLRLQLGRSGRSYVEAHYSRPALARQYLNVLTQVSSARR